MSEHRLPGGRTVLVQHLPTQVVEHLDKRFGELLMSNGGFAEWLLKIDHGVIRYIKLTETEFLEPAHEAKRQQPVIN